ncbi:MAG: hypothetical protein ACXVH0_00925 [Thermoanaerobaculia bacterium]
MLIVPIGTAVTPPAPGPHDIIALGPGTGPGHDAVGVTVGAGCLTVTPR